MSFAPLFITGTGTGVGKTFVTCQLIEALGRRGISAAALKPIETGVLDQPEDGVKLSSSLGRYACHPKLSLETIVPVRYTLAATPAVACGNQPLEWGRIDQAFKVCQKSASLVLIEGAGGALSPLEGDRPLLDLATHFGAQVLVVAPDRLGLIHDLCATLEAIASRGFEPAWCINRFGDGGFERASLPWLKRHKSDGFMLPEQIEPLLDHLIQKVQHD